MIGFNTPLQCSDLLTERQLSFGIGIILYDIYEKGF